jgi:signal transduction histidine kinase
VPTDASLLEAPARRGYPAGLRPGVKPGFANVEIKVLAGFIVAVSLMVLGGGFTYSTSVEFADSVEWVAHTQEVRATLADLYASLAGAELAQRDYLLTGEKKRREDYERLVGVVENQLAAVGSLTSDNPTQRENVLTLRPAVAKGVQAMAGALTAYDHFGLEAARALIATGRRAASEGMPDVLAQIERMDHVEARLLRERQAISARHRQITFLSLLVTLGIGAALLVWLFRGVRREMRGREKLERQLQRKAEQLEVSNKELESFSYSISHDLRAPLRAIDGFALMVLEDYTDRLDYEGRRYLSVIRENSRRMGALIDDLLAFSRLGRQPVAKSQVDMEALTREVLYEALRDYQKTPPTVEIKPLPRAYADRALVRQVWVNLISNALKYCRKSDQPTITVSGSQTDTESVYEISDNGVGFNMAYADKLFGVFQRLHRADEFEGTGVGLAIVERIVSRHGGRVWADGKLDRGATFSFALPTGDHHEGA